MSQDLPDQPRLLNAGNHPQLPTAIGSGLDIDGKYTLEALRPVHRCSELISVHWARCLPRHYRGTMFEVGRKNAMETCEVQARPGNKGWESRQEIERFQQDMS